MRLGKVIGIVTSRCVTMTLVRLRIRFDSIRLVSLGLVCANLLWNSSNKSRQSYMIRLATGTRFRPEDQASVAFLINSLLVCRQTVGCPAVRAAALPLLI